MRRRSSFTAALAVAASCALITACAAPSSESAQAPSSPTVVETTTDASTAAAITVPGLNVGGSQPAPTGAEAVSASSDPETPPPAAEQFDPPPGGEQGDVADPGAGPAPATDRTSRAVPPAPAPAEGPGAAPATPERAGTGRGGGSAPDPDPAPAPAPAPAAAPAPAPAPEQPAAPPNPSGQRVIVIDPGHNGANAAHPEIINKQVDAGFGETKACNTTGTSTDAGFTEHDFNWAVANQLRPLLEARGFTVVMTRSNDDGVGPCVNERAGIGNDAGADAVVSIHGDGADASTRGFYVMTATRDPAGPDIAARSLDLATNVRDGLAGVGLSPSNELGANGLWKRSDLAGLNLSERPTVMVELGNMRNGPEAAFMTSAEGQRQYAEGLALGVANYFGAG